MTTPILLPRRSALRGSATMVGAAFLLAGVLGFVPGVTIGYDRLTFAGHDSGALLLGLFQVSMVHNLVHLAFGVAGLMLARTFNGARGFLLGGGAIYLSLWLYGRLIEQDSPADFVPLNTADNRLHLLLGATMIALGLLTGRRSRKP
ncbi:DUF4383 domain-containing protein [Nonomuraea rubra]|uniref:DUF4383 domain-containing protein n=1 Tax=Nonomuraea rubra TaxID=46180 RepID=A0A7X0P0Y1_9ACTN|nr:DUF4383 domain-containing protein [Nonomuraea rubra]MBB6553233.1 hypothetical protein [Nonomuraea rubra]